MAKEKNSVTRFYSSLHVGGENADVRNKETSDGIDSDFVRKHLIKRHSKLGVDVVCHRGFCLMCQLNGPCSTI